ncbi:N-ethylmaleimide reductase [compost metagenome]
MPVDFKQQLRAVFPGVMVYAGKYTGERARRALEEGWADLIGFGRPFVANPDLPARLKLDAPLAEHERATLFGGDAHGLTDYPALATA